ncbi:MAG: cytochrome c oxidase subunit 3 [Pseudomonas sp.]
MIDDAGTLPEIAPRTAATPAAKAVPGEPGLWVFLFGDMAIFLVFCAAYLVERAGARELFAASRLQLGLGLGLTNTVILLTSSLLVVVALQAVRGARTGPARAALAAALACALAFVTLKGLEYAHLIEAGHGPGSNLYFTYFFILTGLHLSHVLIGLVVLGLMLAQAGRPDAATGQRRRWIEAGACYWHLVDLLWMTVFPLLYLVG